MAALWWGILSGLWLANCTDITKPTWMRTVSSFMAGVCLTIALFHAEYKRER